MKKVEGKAGQFDVRPTDTVDAVVLVRLDGRGDVAEEIALVYTPDADRERVVLAMGIAEFLNGRPLLTTGARDRAIAMAERMEAEWWQKHGGTRR